MLWLLSKRWWALNQPLWIAGLTCEKSFIGLNLIRFSVPCLTVTICVSTVDAAFQSRFLMLP